MNWKNSLPPPPLATNFPGYHDVNKPKKNLHTLRCFNTQCNFTNGFKEDASTHNRTVLAKWFLRKKKSLYIPMLEELKIKLFIAGREKHWSAFDLVLIF